MDIFFKTISGIEGENTAIIFAGVTNNFTEKSGTRGFAHHGNKNCRWPEVSFLPGI